MFQYTIELVAGISQFYTLELEIIVLIYSDLYVNYLSPSPTCSCSEEVEDADHYFFNCSNFNNERGALLRATRDFYPLNIYSFVWR